MRLIGLHSRKCRRMNILALHSLVQVFGRTSDCRLVRWSVLKSLPQVRLWARVGQSFILIGCLSTQTGIVDRALVLHWCALAFAGCELVPDLLCLLYEISVIVVSLFLRPRVDELPLSFSFLFPVKPCLKLLCTYLSLDFRIHFRLLAREYSTLHGCLLLNEQPFSFAHGAVEHAKSVEQNCLLCFVI